MRIMGQVRVWGVGALRGEGGARKGKTLHVPSDAHTPSRNSLAAVVGTRCDTSWHTPQHPRTTPLPTHPLTLTPPHPPTPHRRTQGRLEGVLGYRLGQLNVLGAYPFHWCGGLCVCVCVCVSMWLCVCVVLCVWLRLWLWLCA